MKQKMSLLLLAAFFPAASDGQVNSIRKVNFKNFTFVWVEPEGVPDAWEWLDVSASVGIRLRKGRHEFSDPNDPLQEGQHGPLALLQFVKYGDLDGDGKEEAVVNLYYGTGGTANWAYVYVYRLVQGRPKLMAWLRSGSRADGGLGDVAIKNRTLIMEFADSEKRIADCCSEGYIRVNYKWQQGKFVETGRKRGKVKLEIR